MLQPGRAIELEEKTALKYIKAYPNDLIEFDSLLTGKKRNLLVENRALESELEEFKLSSSISLEENERLKQANQSLTNRISDLEKEMEEATKPEVTKARPDEGTKKPGSKQNGNEKKE